MDLRHLLFAVTLFIILITRASGKCRFPKIVQAHATSSWWLYHIKYGGARTSGDTLYFVEFLSEQMFMTPVPGTESDEHPDQIQRECVQKTSNGSYIVRSTTGPREYFCLKFIFRSSTVFQLETSEPFQRADDTKCNKLHLDPWPMIRYITDESDYEPCPLTGGFQMKLRDISGESLCDSYVMSPRFECGCEQPKGIMLKLDHCKAARDILVMDARQKLHCLATWHDENMGLVMVTKRDDAVMFWMVTVKETSPLTFSGVITNNIIIEPDFITNQTISLTLKQVVYRSTCADLADMCVDIQNQTCPKNDIVSMTLCPASCGQCSPEPSETRCSFKTGMQGSWLGFKGTEMFNLTVEDHLIHAGEIEMRCEERDALLDTYTLVTFKNDGCYPEYKCLKVRRVFDNVVKYDYEGGPSWPVFIKSHLCTPYVTKNDIRHRQQMSLAFKAPEDDVTVCDIPSGTYESEVLFSDGIVCVAVMSKQNCNGTSADNGSVTFDVYFNDCSLEGVLLIQYSCVMQLPTNEPSRKIALVRTAATPPSYYCLLYDADFTEMVILPASKCYDHLNSDVIATHSMTLRSLDCMDGLPLTTRPTQTSTTVEVTSESFYDVIYDEMDQLEGDYDSHGVVLGQNGGNSELHNSTSMYEDFGNSTKLKSDSSSIYKCIQNVWLIFGVIILGMSYDLRCLLR